MVASPGQRRDLRSRAPIGVAVLLPGLLVAVLAGCSSDSDDPGPSRPTSTSAAPTTSAPTQTEPPSPTVTPATGPEIVARNLDDEPVLRLHLPEDITWRIQPGGDSASGENADDDVVDIGTRVLPTRPGDELDEYADLTVDAGSARFPNLERVADREVAGVTGYVAKGEGEKFSYIFGGIHGDSQVDVTFRFPKDDAQAREWIESSLASVEWL
jgi:hypothetical protein